MSRFRLSFLESLARQMAFSPAIIREKQIQAAEDFLLSVDPAKAYPPAYVVFRLTAYRPDARPEEQVTGLALQHDLGLLIEQVSDTLNEKSVDRAEPVLQIDDLVAKFNVTSKTIQRWRRRGLSARRFIFPDGKRRVGFRLAIVDRFFAAHGASLQDTVNVTRIESREWSTILRHARRLAADPRRPVSEIAARVGHAVGRSALAIEAELKAHDAKYPAEAVLAGRPLLPPAAAADVVRRLTDQGLSIDRIACVLDLPQSTTYRLLLAHRLDRIVKRRIKFLDDPLYHQPDAEGVLEHLLTQDPIVPATAEPQDRMLSSELRSLCVHPLLTPTQERALFLQYNFRKYQAAAARRKLDPMRAGRRHIVRVERLLARATDVRNRIIQANLRLVVSVAKKHVRPHLPLADLVSEGSLTLMRAVEGFDTRKGHKFSTYATLALMKGFARTAGKSKAGPVVMDGNAMADKSLCTRDDHEQFLNHDRVTVFLTGLDPVDRSTVCRHFGLTHGADDAALPTKRFDARLLTKLRASVTPES